MAGVMTVQMRQVVAALVAAEPSLADDGWTNQGHWYECENGHPCFIANCSGATQESKCPECGEPIGGSAHHLHDSN